MGDEERPAESENPDGERVRSNALLGDEEDICGLCGRPGADKIPHPIHWPGEQVPEGNVHAACEDEECKRAHRLLSDKERRDFLKWC